LASFGIKTLSSALDRSWSRKAYRVLRNKAANSPQEFEALISTIRTASIRGFGAFSEEAAAETHMAQLQHNMWVVAARSAVLSVITGGGKWVEITTYADPLYQHLIRRWYQANTGQVLTDVQQQIRHPVLRWMAATLDGRVEADRKRR
jgi:hypothetical protein